MGHLVARAAGFRLCGSGNHHRHDVLPDSPFNHVDGADSPYATGEQEPSEIYLVAISSCSAGSYVALFLLQFLPPLAVARARPSLANSGPKMMCQLLRAEFFAECLSDDTQAESDSCCRSERWGCLSAAFFTDRSIWSHRYADDHVPSSSITTCAKPLSCTRTGQVDHLQAKRPVTGGPFFALPGGHFNRERSIQAVFSSAVSRRPVVLSAVPSSPPALPALGMSRAVAAAICLPSTSGLTISVDSGTPASSLIGLSLPNWLYQRGRKNSGYGYARPLRRRPAPGSGGAGSEAVSGIAQRRPRARFVPVSHSAGRPLG
jgi:hypothetical protein